MMRQKERNHEHPYIILYCIVLYQRGSDGKGYNRTEFFICIIWRFSRSDSPVSEYQENQEEMIDIELLKNELRRDEGVKRYPYYDTVGKLSIATGRNLTDNGVSEGEIDLMLINDIQSAVYDLQGNFDWYKYLSPARKRAVINMVFNMGLSKFKGFKRMIKALSIGYFDRAALECLDSRAARQLPERYGRIANAIKKG